MSRLPKPSGLPVPKSGIARPTPAGQPPSTSATGLTVRATGSRTTTSRVVSSGYGRPTPSAVPQPATSRPSVPRTSQIAGPSSRPSSAGTKETVSKTKITVTKPSGQKKTAVKADKTVDVKASASGSKAKLGAPVGVKRSQAAVPIPPPSLLRKQVALQVKGQAAKAKIGCKVTAVAAKKTAVPPLEKIMTPAGPQQVIQKVITEKRVERSKCGEVVSRNIKTIELNQATGETIQVEEETQQLNPHFKANEGPVKETVTIVSERDITEAFESRIENVVRETTKLDAGLGMDLQQVSQLVEEEKEDVENALRINPPELVTQAPDKFPLRKKLQTLKLSPENIVLLEEAVVKPPISADDPLPEPSPEVMAQIIDAMDKSMQPKQDTEMTFNSLFTENMEPQAAMLNISSVAPGPLADVVVPSDSVPEIIQEEMLSKSMEEAAILVQTTAVKPADFNFSVLTPVEPKKKVRKKWERYKMITDEDPPWKVEDILETSAAVGAFPEENLDATNILETTQRGGFSEEIEKGIEYYLECNTLQYFSRVQLRGSQPPPWFPGYIYALSDMSNGVEVGKSPSQVMFAAWRSVQPEVFPNDSIVYN
ncbi:hypothetical protein WA026_006895 [Henosepilachna vigintioctopunctata]|uniref:Uncharacterized protein n=1 Tax=Henosepilachna vigintioctopunctata TaxID=420089 RepID=A0AAW1V4F3_9CUCU